MEEEEEKEKEKRNKETISTPGENKILSRTERRKNIKI